HMTLETGIIIVGAHNVQAAAIPLLQRYSPHLLTVFPAHITLMYPFVPVDALDPACRTVRAIGQEIAPFAITMRGYGQFPRTTFMTPADPAPILAVFRRIFAAFPDYPPYRGEFGNDLHPHMTVAMFGDDAAQQQAEFPDYGAISFTVDRLHVVYGPNTLDLPWLTYDVIPLRGR
ncbi:MAG: 2'-5' RNA ligase family protein, partial [Anaerolineae bacterium]|nr:2'-5' RNA ligase family protein [Anaerolineae bacterium]